jgi:hypothetical protein
MYRVLAGVVVGLHLTFLAYVVAGGFLAWRWPRSLLAHVAMVGWGLAGLATPVPCPLTDLQNALRHRAGQPDLASGFIDEYVEGVLYPGWFTPLVRVLVAAAIVVSWVGVYTRWRSRRHPRAVGSGVPD